MSLSSRRAWIEILSLTPLSILSYASLSSRRAWIEIVNGYSGAYKKVGRSPHGERGLKSDVYTGTGGVTCRSPHGERGLK